MHRCRTREREMFYLTTHSTHFIYGYMASDIWLRTILIVRKETRCRHIGYSYRLTARVLLYTPSHRQDSTYHGLCYTSRGALAGTRNSSMGCKCTRTDIWFVKIYEFIHADISDNSHHFEGYFDFMTISMDHDWCNKGRGMCYPVCGMVHIKEPLLLIGKSSLCGGSGFPFSLPEWSLTICLTPYNRK